MNSIDDIRIHIPDTTVELPYFQKLISLCSNASRDNTGDVRISSHRALRPVISLTQTASVDPAISFMTDTGKETDCFLVGKLPLCFNGGDAPARTKPIGKPSVAKKSDAIGDYLDVAWPNATYSQLSFKQLYGRIKGKTLHVDHIGININPGLLPKVQYDRMKRMVAERSYLVDYPFGHEWPFIIPATDDERGHIIQTRLQRDPKFEFVYDFSYPYPEIQMDIQATLPPNEVKHLFPQPYGYYDPTPLTGDYCVSVFIYTGWAHTSLRVDVRFFVAGMDLTDMLLNKGQRVQ